MGQSGQELRRWLVESQRGAFRLPDNPTLDQLRFLRTWWPRESTRTEDSLAKGKGGPIETR
jgi:hypothetical protein